MHIDNETNIETKICLYKPADKLDWAPVGAGVFVVKPGTNHEWTPPSGEGLDKYHIKVFKPGLIDGLLCEVNDAPVDGDFVVRGGGNHYEITKK